jgi:hypothetical protein
MRISIALLVLSLSLVPAAAEVGALQTDCNLGGPDRPGTYQFVATCAGRALSPDGHFAIVQRAYTSRQPPIELQDGNGRTLQNLKNLSDDMPFLVAWSPDSHWFFVNHHVGSFMDVLQVFEMVGGRAVERPALGRAAVRLAVRRYPCLPPRGVLPNGARWSADSRRIVLWTISRPDVCSGMWGNRRGEWRPLWMIGDVQSGRIDPASIRVQVDGTPFDMPRDGPYAQP